jgi:hypothetical protein
VGGKGGGGGRGRNDPSLVFTYLKKNKFAPVKHVSNDFFHKRQN